MADKIPSRRRRRRASGKGMENAAFEDGTDFIPLDADSDHEKVEKGKDQDRSARRKDDERKRERIRHAPSPRPPSMSPPPLPRRDSDSRDRRTRDSRENGQENGHTREWDRGKRKYDMVLDPSDGYRSKKQRTDANSRLAPWVDHVEWEGCESVSELCVNQTLHRQLNLTVTQVPSRDRGLRELDIAHTAGRRDSRTRRSYYL